MVPATPPPSTPTTVTWSASTASACTPAVSSGTPFSSLGGVGDIYNAIAPSLTLGCGSYGGNSVSGNVRPSISSTSSASLGGTTTCSGSRFPAKTYFEPNAIKYLRDMYGIEKAVIVCDKVMEQLGIVDKIIDQLRARSNRVTFRIIDYVEPEPSVETVERAAEMMREEFEPDTIIAVGGGSPDGCLQDYVAALRAPGNRLLRRAREVLRYP